MDFVSLGERVRIRRKEMKLTQERLAELVDLSQSLIGHVERGTRVPSVETLHRLCKALGVSADYLMGQ